MRPFNTINLDTVPDLIEEEFAVGGKLRAIQKQLTPEEFCFVINRIHEFVTDVAKCHGAFEKIIYTHKQTESTRDIIAMYITAKLLEMPFSIIRGPVTMPASFKGSPDGSVQIPIAIESNYSFH